MKKRMENLIDLISFEFDKAGYKPISNVIWKHVSYPDFWVVLRPVGVYNLNQLQTELFDDLAKIREKSPESEKNTTLLILNQVTGEHRDERKVIEDENDAYMFKKYVIQYIKEEWDSARQQLPIPFDGLGKLLMQPDNFSSMKETQRKSDFTLLYTIAHKLPFVLMDVEKKEFNAEPELELSDDIKDIYGLIDSCLDFSSNETTTKQLEQFSKEIEKLININGNG